MFDNIDIDVHCPNCNRKIKVKLNKLRKSPQVRCIYCSSDIKINADTREFDRTEAKIKRELSDFNRSLERMFK